MGGPHLTDKARAASLVKRRERAAQKADNTHHYDVVVIRSAEPCQYSWQIRRYGAILVKETDSTFLSLADARAAGEAALTELSAGSPKVERALLAPSRSRQRPEI